MKVFCLDSQVNKLVLLFLGGAVILIPFMLILVSDVHIVSDSLRVPSAQGMLRVSLPVSPTCCCCPVLWDGDQGLPMSFVLFLQLSRRGHTAAVMCTVVTPLLNPVIYTPRTKDVKQAPGRLFS